MKVYFFSAKPYDEEFFSRSNTRFNHSIHFLEPRLFSDTVSLVKPDDNGAPLAVCVFVNDVLDKPILKELGAAGVKLIALRCSGYNNVDLAAAAQVDIKVVNVPSYSPNAVAEHSLALMLALNRKIHRAAARVSEGNFSLNGLLGFDFNGRTAGIIGTGNIGSIVAKILVSMGMRVLAYDPVKNEDCLKEGVQYVDLSTLFTESDVISLHCPLIDVTAHLINGEAIEKMKPGVMIINTSRGAVLDTCAVIEGLKSGKIGYLGLDVYENEADLFFKDLSCEVIKDEIFQRLMTFPNVLVTAHQGFFTAEALTNIADTTLENLTSFENGLTLNHQLNEHNDY